MEEQEEEISRVSTREQEINAQIARIQALFARQDEEIENLRAELRHKEASGSIIIGLLRRLLGRVSTLEKKGLEQTLVMYRGAHHEAKPSAQNLDEQIMEFVADIGAADTAFRDLMLNISLG